MNLFSIKLVAAILGVGVTAGFALRQPETVPTALRAATLREACKDGCTAERIHLWQDTMMVEAQDLNADGKPEYLVHVCNTAGGEEGNTTWVFESTGNAEYHLLVVGSTLSASKESHDGWRDLEGKIGYPEGEPQPYRFQFTNGAYRLGSLSVSSGLQ